MKIFSWGCNSHGQLGQGVETEQVNEPSPASSEFDVRSVVGGGRHTVILSGNGNVYSCGDNNQGQLSRDQRTQCLRSFLSITRFRFEVVKISCGWDFNLVLSDDGLVFGWGGNSFGQLGFSPQKSLFIHEPREIFPGQVIDIAAGVRHSVIVTRDGSVYSTGFGRRGQLGFPLRSGEKIVTTFTKVESVKGARKISCGENHCILSTDKGLYSWGDNKFGQLGVNPSSLTASLVPIRVDCEIKGSNVKTLVSGWSHNAILTNKNEVISWGRGDYGQLGERRHDNWKPKQVDALTNTQQIALGSNHGLALTNDGRILSWGWNEHGNCGNGSCETIYEPLPLRNITSEPCVIGAGSAHSFYCTN